MPPGPLLRPARHASSLAESDARQRSRLGPQLVPRAAPTVREAPRRSQRSDLYGSLRAHSADCGSVGQCLAPSRLSRGPDLQSNVASEGAPPLARCNGLDDDCDGAIDEGDGGYGEYVVAPGANHPESVDHETRRHTSGRVFGSLGVDRPTPDTPKREVRMTASNGAAVASRGTPASPSPTPSAVQRSAGGGTRAITRGTSFAQGEAMLAPVQKRASGQAGDAGAGQSPVPAQRGAQARRRARHRRRRRHLRPHQLRRGNTGRGRTGWAGSGGTWTSRASTGGTNARTSTRWRRAWRWRRDRSAHPASAPQRPDREPRCRGDVCQ